MSLLLTQPVVEEMEEDTPTSEGDETRTSTPESGMPPLPGFPPFMFPEDDGGMEADEICDCSETSFTEQFIASDTGGGLRLFASTVGEQWCYARTGTDACPPSANNISDK